LPTSTPSESLGRRLFFVYGLSLFVAA
jgi:hypothetical protein